MKINPDIFRNYDIRGVAEVDLNIEKVEAIGKAYGTFLRKRKIYDAVVGRDCRLSGKKYQTAFIKGLRATGVNAINIGMVMTQMMYYAQYRFQTNGGAMVTASHNPANYNGFKLAVGYSKTTGAKEIAEIKKIIDEDRYYKSGELGKITAKNIKKDYCDDLLKRIKLKKKFKVLIDSGHGTTGIYAPVILKKSGCEVIGKNLKPDGRFPKGTPDPTSEEFMERVKNEVLKEKADCGLAFDGDGDRLGVVDEKGNILWNDILIAIFAKEALERFPGAKIVYNTLCSQVVRKVIEENGGAPIIWKTGHSFIKAKIAEEGAIFGGELSGHFFFVDNFYGHDDGIFAALRILEYLSEKNLTLSQLYDSFPKYIASPEIKIGCPDNEKSRVIKNLSHQLKNDFPRAIITDENIIPNDDGVRVDFEDGMMLFRYSQNGPYITVRFDAKNEIKYRERKNYIKTTLEKHPEIIWKDELCVNLDSLK